MKKMLMLLMFVLGTSISGFAQSETSAFETIKNEVINRLKETPSNTVYGIVESTSEKYVVNTPLGKYEILKKNDGNFEMFGVSAKIESVKGHIYVINSSIGKFRIDTKKCIVVKL